MRDSLVQFVLVTSTSCLLVSCGPVDESNNGDTSNQELCSSVEVDDARFISPSDGKNRLYVVANVSNDSCAEDIGVNVTKLRVVTDGAGALNSGFHSPNTPEDVEKCSTSDFGTHVPEGSSHTCGFVVESASDFEPLRLEYSMRSLVWDETASDDFPDDIPRP
jgi:hypothetical protein